MAIEKLTFLDEVGIQKLSEALLSRVNTRIAERIVQEVNDASDGNHVASAAVLNALLKAKDTAIAANTTAIGANTTAIGEAKTSITELGTKVDDNKTAIDSATTDLAALSTKVDGLTHLTIDTVTGAIDTVVEPSTSILYLQRDDEADKTWMLYIYREDGTWVNIGDTEVDLSNYWSKDDVDAMKEALGVPEMVAMTEAQITAAVEAAFKNTDALRPELTGIEYAGTGGSTRNILMTETCTFSVKPVPANALLPTIKYTSNDESIATVSEDGVITPVSHGSTHIVAKSAENLSIYCTFSVTVVAEIPVTVVGSESETNFNGTYWHTNSASIEAGTKEGYRFAGWTCDKSYVVIETDDPETTFSFDFTSTNGKPSLDPVTITANWVQEYSINTSNCSVVKINGTTTPPTGKKKAIAGDTIEVNAYAIDGKTFDRFTTSPAGIQLREMGMRNTVEFTMPEADVSITANFL